MTKLRQGNPCWERSSRSTILARLRDELMEIGQPQQLHSLVDLACGPAGTCALGFAPKVDRVVAFDSNPETVTKCHNAVEDAGMKNIEVRLQDVQIRWPLEDASVDLVSGVGAISNIDHPRKALDEVRRVLKADGRLLVGDFCVPFAVHEIWGVLSSLRYGSRRPYLDYFQYMDLLLGAGFEVVEYRPIRWKYRMDESLSNLADEARRGFLQAVRDMEPTSQSLLRADFDGDSLIVEHDCFALKARVSDGRASRLIDDTVKPRED